MSLLLSQKGVKPKGAPCKTETNPCAARSCHGWLAGLHCLESRLDQESADWGRGEGEGPGAQFTCRKVAIVMQGLEDGAHSSAIAVPNYKVVFTQAVLTPVHAQLMQLL